MKATEIRDLTADDIQQKVHDLKEALFNLRFQHEIGQLENPNRMKQTRRDIAQVKTIIREFEMKNEIVEE